MSKKILLVFESLNGVSYHRMTKPNGVLGRIYPEFEFDVINGLVAEDHEQLTDEFLSNYNLIIFGRHIAHYDYIELLVARLNKLCIKFGLDLDDYWELPTNHLAYKDYKQNNYARTIIESIKVSHFVITTTETLANKIKEFNPNVFVIENGIDTQDEVWRPYNAITNRLRYGFIGGSTHVNDLALIAESCKKVLNDNKLYGKVQMVCGGFHSEAGKSSPYIAYEWFMTDKLKALRLLPKYTEYLKRCTEMGNKEFVDVPYKRIWQMPVNQFALMYNEIDVSLAPLEANVFNSCKSPLKLIEAGFKGKAIVVSDVDPYTGIANDSNAFLLGKKTFYEIARYINENPNSVKDKAKQLTEDTKKYSLTLLAERRKQLYESYI